MPRTFGVAHILGAWEHGELLDGRWFAHHDAGRFSTRAPAAKSLRRTLTRLGQPVPRPVPALDIDPRTMRVRETA